MDKPKKKQNQPKTHAPKSKAAAKARRKKIVKAILDGKTQQQAGVEAGLNPKTANSQVSKILQEPQTKECFAAMLNKVIPDKVQADKYLELLNATKVISCNVIAPNGEGMADANSMTKDFVEVPDFATQLRANDSISKLKGYAVDKIDQTVRGKVVLMAEPIKKRAR